MITQHEHSDIIHIMKITRLTLSVWTQRILEDAPTPKHEREIERSRNFGMER